MKKSILILLLSILLYACKKNATPSPIVNNAIVQYVYDAGNKGDFSITYTGSDGKPIDTTFTGQFFTKVITTTRSSGFKIATLTIMATQPNVGGSMSITVNNDPEIINVVSFPNIKGTYTSSYSTSVFN